LPSAPGLAATRPGGYPDIATGYPLPNWFNGYPPIDARMLMGPMSYRAGVEGVLYYATNHWTVSQHADHPLVDDGIFSEYSPVTFLTTAGDGSLFYPGPDGPMASIRIENFRDGMEDYNLLGTLRKALTENPDAPAGVRKLARQLLSASDVVTDARNFTEDPVAYRHWRDRVAWVITRLQHEASTAAGAGRPDARERDVATSRAEVADSTP
jgi:Domain of unknown function (DUF4091)